MKNIVFFCALALMGLSCSKTLQRRYDQRHGTYTDDYRSYSRYDRSNSDRDSYRRDYDKQDRSSSGGYSSGYSNAGRTNSQYEEMDKLADDVLFEIDIMDKRYDLLMDEYRSANKSNKEVISGQLDRISDDRLTLYRAFTRIYRNGRSSWSDVRSEVENILGNVRRVNQR